MNIHATVLDWKAQKFQHELATESTYDEARKLLHSRKVQIAVYHGNQVLREQFKVFPDGRRDYRELALSISETLRHWETPVDAARRGLQEELGADAEVYEVLMSGEPPRVSEYHSNLYAGIRRRTETFEATYMMPVRFFNPNGYEETDEFGIVTVTQWVNL